MSEMFNKVKKHTVENKKFIFIIILLGLFIGLAYWAYTTYIAPGLHPDYTNNKEFDLPKDGEGITDATIYAFYTTWCPYCKTKIIAKDSGWKNIMKEYNGKKINGVTLTFVEVDGEISDVLLRLQEKQKERGHPPTSVVKVQIPGTSTKY